MTKPEAAAPLPEPLDNSDTLIVDLRGYSDRLNNVMTSDQNVTLVTTCIFLMRQAADALEASACAAQPSEPPDIEMMAVAMTEWARLIRLAEDQQTLLAIADDIDLNATSLASPKTPLLADDDFSDAVIRAGLQAQADALAPKETRRENQELWAGLQRLQVKFHNELAAAVAQARAGQREQDAQLVWEKFKDTDVALAAFMAAAIRRSGEATTP